VFVLLVGVYLLAVVVSVVSCRVSAVNCWVSLSGVVVARCPMSIVRCWLNVDCHCWSCRLSLFPLLVPSSDDYVIWKLCEVFTQNANLSALFSHTTSAWLDDGSTKGS
jgi:hypothetical protein